MRYRLAILCLAAVLGVLPGLNTAPAVPIPAKLKRPEIYALIYVGLGKNDPDNAKRIANAIQELPSSAISALFCDQDVNALTIVRNKKRELSKDGWIDWARSKTRAVSLGGTTVVRVWFTDASPEEKVALANAIASTYVEHQQRAFRGALEQLAIYKANYIKNTIMRPLNQTEARSFRRQEEAIKHLPHIIEWAALPEKP